MPNNSPIENNTSLSEQEKKDLFDRAEKEEDPTVLNILKAVFLGRPREEKMRRTKAQVAEKLAPLRESVQEVKAEAGRVLEEEEKKDLFGRAEKEEDPTVLNILKAVFLGRPHEEKMRRIKAQVAEKLAPLRESVQEVKAAAGRVLEEKEDASSLLPPSLAEVPSVAPIALAPVPAGIPSEEQVQERQSLLSEIKSLSEEIKKSYEVSGPKVLEKFKEIDRITNADIRAALDKSDPTTGLSITGLLHDTSSRLKEIQTEKKELVERTNIGRAMEAVGQSLTQLFLGIYGMKHGVDVSGVKFSQSDWAGILRERLGEANEELRLVKEQRRELLEREEDITREAQGAAREEKSEILREAKELVGEKRAELSTMIRALTTQYSMDRRFEQQEKMWEQRVAAAKDTEERKEAQKNMDLLNKQKERETKNLTNLQLLMEQALHAEKSDTRKNAKRQINNLFRSGQFPTEFAGFYGTFVDDEEKAVERLQEYMNTRAKSSTAPRGRVFEADGYLWQEDPKTQTAIPIRKL